MQCEELQEAVEESQPAMFNSRLKNWRNAVLREGKVQKQPEACPAFERRSAQQKHRSGTTKLFNRNIICFNCGRQGHIKRDCRLRNIESMQCSFAKGGKSLSTGVKGQTLECANGKRMPFILVTGSVESLIASADLRKFLPGNCSSTNLSCNPRRNRASLVSSWPNRNSNSVIHRTCCSDSVSGHAKGSNTSWPQRHEATVSEHYSPD